MNRDSRRPRERGDPYGEELRFRLGVEAFFHFVSEGLWVPAFAGTTNSRGLLLQRLPGELGIILQHHAVDIGGEIGEAFGALSQLRCEEGRQSSGERA